MFLTSAQLRSGPHSALARPVQSITRIAQETVSFPIPGGPQVKLDTHNAGVWVGSCRGKPALNESWTT